LDAEKIKEEKMQEITQKLASSMPVLIEKFAEELFEGNIINDHEAWDRAEYLKLDFTNSIFQVVVVQIDNYNTFLEMYKEEHRQFIKFSLISMIKENLDSRNILVNFKKSNAFFLIIDPHNTDTAAQEDQLLNKLKSIQNQCKGLHISAYHSELAIM
jgi:ASC-1-like (ASCH) protein